MTKQDLMAELKRRLSILDEAFSSDDLLINLYARDVSNVALLIAEYDDIDPPET